MEKEMKKHTHTLFSLVKCLILFFVIFFCQVYTQIVSVSRATFLCAFKKFEEIYRGFKALL